MNDVTEKLAIQDLTARYAFYTDTLQRENWLSLWTDDGVFDETATGTGYHAGQSELRTFFQQIEGIMADQVHFGGSHIIELCSDSEATGILYAIVEGHTKQDGYVRAVIYYDDVYRKTGGKWRFAKRKVTPLMPFDTSSFVAGMEQS